MEEAAFPQVELFALAGPGFAARLEGMELYLDPRERVSLARDGLAMDFGLAAMPWDLADSRQCRMAALNDLHPDQTFCCTTAAWIHTGIGYLERAHVIVNGSRQSKSRVAHRWHVPDAHLYSPAEGTCTDSLRTLLDLVLSCRAEQDVLTALAYVARREFSAKEWRDRFVADRRGTVERYLLVRDLYDDAA